MERVILTEKRDTKSSRKSNILVIAVVGITKINAA